MAENVKLLHQNIDSEMTCTSVTLKFEHCQTPRLTGSAVITHDVTIGTGYCLVGFNWIIDFLN